MKKTVISYFFYILLAAAVAFAQPSDEGVQKEESLSSDRKPWREKREKMRPHPQSYQKRDFVAGGPHGLLNNPHVQKFLELTEEQQQQLSEGSAELESEKEQLRTALEAAAMKQAAILTESVVDEEKLMQAVEETGRIRTDMAKNRMKHLMLIRRVLTPEQTDAAKNMMQQNRGEFMREVHQRRKKSAEE